MIRAVLLGALLVSADAWLDTTLEVLNPEVVGGRTLVTVGDLVGPDAQPSRGGRARVMVIARVRPGDCTGPQGLCAELERGLAERFSLASVRLALVVVPSPSEAEARARARLVSPKEAILAFDGRGLAAHVAGLDRPGEVALVFADGRRVEVDVSSEADPVEPIAERIATGL